MKKILEGSLLYRLISAVAAWLDRQWERSFTGALLTGSGREAPGFLSRWGAGARRLLCRVFRALRLDRLLRGSVFLHSFFWMGLAVLIAPIAPTMAVLAAVLVALFSLAARLCMEPERRTAASPLKKWVVAFAVVYMGSTLLSVDLSGSLPGGLLVTVFTLFALAVMELVDSRERLEKLWNLIVLSGAAVALVGIAQAALGLQSAEAWVDQDSFQGLTLRVYSTLGNPNVLSEYLMLVIPMSAAAAVNAKTANGRMAAGLAFLTMTVCLALTYARGGYLGIAFAAAVFLILLDRRFIALGIVGILALLPLLPQSILTRLMSIGDLGDSSTSYRVYIWLATLNLLRDYWLCGFGTGVAAFQAIYPKYSFNAVSAPHAHNLFLQIFCECGIFGLFTLLGVFVSAVRLLGGAVSRACRADKVRCSALIASFTGFAVQSMTDHSFYNYRVVLMFWVIVGLSAAAARLTVREDAQ